MNRRTLGLIASQLTDNDSLALAGEEDAVLHPLIMEHMTRAEYDATTVAIIKRSFKAVHYELPWAVENMSKADRDEFFTEVPAPLLWMLRNKWGPHWKARVTPLLDSIIDDKVASPHTKPAPSWFWWTGIVPYQPGEPQLAL